MVSKENSFTVWSFIFGLIAVVMIIMPYIATFLFVQTEGNSKLGGAAFFLTLGMMMTAFGFFSWVASIALMAVNLICHRAGIKTILGRIGVLLNIICFLYYAFLIYMIAR